MMEGQLALFVDELGNTRIVEEDEYGSITFLDDGETIEAQCNLEDIEVCESCQ